MNEGTVNRLKSNNIIHNAAILQIQIQYTNTQIQFTILCQVHSAEI